MSESETKSITVYIANENRSIKFEASNEEQVRDKVAKKLEVEDDEKLLVFTFGGVGFKPENMQTEWIAATGDNLDSMVFVCHQYQNFKWIVWALEWDEEIIVEDMTQKALDLLMTTTDAYYDKGFLKLVIKGKILQDEKKMGDYDQLGPGSVIIALHSYSRGG
eukprot:TRINITY_DN1485_c0_g2_i1.p1 TRINITY_DN1485_c0_g2~~TRINITY_DN1485_c0_g2_i1.p1  ORF type:complete len:163 (-),score=51.90 TRINITY_DN1485_c0_g2_i1:85-573(-)